MSELQPAECQSAVDAFRSQGHATIPDVFSSEDVNAAIRDIENWSETTLRDMDESQRSWYLEQGGRSSLLRKLDQPVFHREVFRRLAHNRKLLLLVRELIGAEALDVCFSQVFMKPPEVGGPKPIHQDNFYFGPDDPDSLVTAWVALDHATLENGCLYYGDGSHREGVFEHFAPEGEPFNLQAKPEYAERYEFQPAPVPQGGVSLHHGNTLHRSSANTSSQARRAVAIHYLDRSAKLVAPALEYDASLFVSIDSSSLW